MAFRKAKHNHGMHNYEINNNVDLQSIYNILLQKQGKEGIKYQE